MQEIHERLFVGSEGDCFRSRSGWAVVHACKSPCHQQAVGYRGSLPSDHPNYLVLEDQQNLFLNIIDPPIPLFKHETFASFLTFSEEHWNKGENLLIHCNLGESRAPTLALLFMAKRLNALPASSYPEAKQQFAVIFPSYSPGQGIQTFLIQHWNEI